METKWFPIKHAGYTRLPKMVVRLWLRGTVHGSQELGVYSELFESDARTVAEERRLIGRMRIFPTNKTFTKDSCVETWTSGTALL